MIDSYPCRNAHERGIFVTYPYHPQCGEELKILRTRSYQREEYYEAIDIYGGCSGVPIWMTNPQWKGLELSPHPRVSASTLLSVTQLVQSLNVASNGEESSFERSGYEQAAAEEPSSEEKDSSGASTKEGSSRANPTHG